MLEAYTEGGGDPQIKSCSGPLIVLGWPWLCLLAYSKQLWRLHQAIYRQQKQNWMLTDFKIKTIYYTKYSVTSQNLMWTEFKCKMDTTRTVCRDLLEVNPPTFSSFLTMFTWWLALSSYWATHYLWIIFQHSKTVTHPSSLFLGSHQIWLYCLLINSILFPLLCTHHCPLKKQQQVGTNVSLGYGHMTRQHFTHKQ